MSNCGKFVDRNPTIRAAGKCTTHTESTGSSLRPFLYPLGEAAENIMRKKCQEIRGNLLSHDRYIPEDTLKELLSPELQKSRFVVFREKLAENMYLRKPKLAKVFPLNLKPEHITNDSTTFGDAIVKSEPAYDIILPRKTPNEVNREYISWHDKYIISHNHYLPGEQISRNYTKPFDRHNFFGVLYDVDVNGKYVKRAMEQCDKLILVSKAQKQFLERTKGRLGHTFNRQNSNITPDTCFGTPSAGDQCNIKALMEYQDQCEPTSPLITAIAHLNEVRQNLFQRHNFHMQDLEIALEALDTNKTGLLTLKQIFEVMRQVLVNCNPEKLLVALRHFQLIENESLPNEAVKYEELWKLLHMQYPIPKTGNISKMPPNIYNKDTTYRLMCQDRTKPAVEATRQLMAIGHPKHAEAPTTVKDVIWRDIPMHFCLAPSDFAKQRSKEELRRIFKRLLNGEKFEVIWTIAQNIYKRMDELISVDEMRRVMSNENKK